MNHCYDRIRILLVYVSWIEQLGKQEFIPGILKARHTPVHTICIANRICNLFRSQWTPLLLVYWGMRIFSVIRELCDVEKCDREFRFAKYISDHLHYASPAIRSPVRGVVNRRCFAVTTATRFASPVYAPAQELQTLVPCLDKLNHCTFLCCHVLSSLYQFGANHNKIRQWKRDGRLTFDE